MEREDGHYSKFLLSLIKLAKEGQEKKEKRTNDALQWLNWPLTTMSFRDSDDIVTWLWGAMNSTDDDRRVAYLSIVEKRLKVKRLNHILYGGN